LAAPAAEPNLSAASDYLARAKRYRDKVEECRQLASLAQNEGARESYLIVADNYEKAANDVELLASLKLPSGRQLG
jgi:hypothetical protein